MKSRYVLVITCVLALTFFCATARAEKVFTVNDNNTGLFDQPSVSMWGAVAHVAFIGDTSGTGAGYKVYYAALNAVANYQDVLLQRDNTVILSPAATIDNTDLGNDTYVDARHPKIVARSATDLVILFQAKPTSTADTAYRLYIARLTLSGNTVIQKSVKLVQGMAAGTVEDASFAIVVNENAARVAYSTRSAIAAPEPFQVLFARIGLDNATASTPIGITASYPGSLGFRPLPSLKLDEINREHIAWIGAGTPGTTSGPVYYAMIDQTNGIDNMLIAPSPVMTLYATGYTFPTLMVVNQSLITVLAGDGTTGRPSYVQVNPNQANRKGMPLLDNVANNDLVLLVPPGEPTLPDNFSVFRPEAFYESGSERIFVTGYPTAANAPSAKFIAFRPNSPLSSADLVTAPSSFATADIPFPGLPGDYTKLAFGFPGGKIIVVWPTALPSGNRNLDVTTIPTVAAWVNSNEKGCGMVPGPSRGASGKIPGTLLLLLPAAALAARHLLKRGRRPLSAGTAPGPQPPAGGTIGR